MYQITRIEIEGFGGYEREVLEFTKPINIFIGKNDAGKTTLANAIRWAVTGQAVTKTRRGQNALINDQAKKARVKLTIDGTVEIERTRTSRSESLRFVRDGKAAVGTPTDVQKAIYRFLGADTPQAEDAFKLGLMPEAWFERKDRHEFLHTLLPDAATVEAITDGLMRQGVDAELAGEWAAVAKDQGFDVALKGVVEQRREAKRARDEAQRQVVDGSVTSKVKGDKREAEELLISLSTERDTALRELGAIEARSDAPDPTEQVEAAELEIADAERRFEKFNVEGIASTIKDIDAKQGSLNEGLKEKADAAAQAEAVLPPLPKAGEPIGTCPLLLTKCPKNRQEQLDLLKQANKVRATQEKKLSTLNSEMKGLRATGDMLQKRREELDGQLFEAMRVEEKIQSLKQNLERLKQATGSERPTPEQVAEAREKLAALNARIAKGNEIVSELRRYQERAAASDAAREAVTNQEARIDQLDRIADAFKPDGLPQELAKGGVAELVSKAHDGAEAFGVAWGLDDDYLPVIQGKPYYLQSKSGQFRGAVILADALAQVAKVPWLLLDNCEQLDGENRANLVSLVSAGRYHLVALFAAQGTEEVPAGTDDPEIDVWFLDGSGHCERREAA